MKAAEESEDQHDANSDSDTSSIFDESSSTTSTDSSITSASGATANQEDQEQEPTYTEKDLRDVIGQVALEKRLDTRLLVLHEADRLCRFIAMRCTESEWHTVLYNANFDPQDIPPWSRSVLERLCFRSCPKSPYWHNFEENQCCVSCREQLCEVSAPFSTQV